MMSITQKPTSRGYLHQRRGRHLRLISGHLDVLYTRYSLDLPPPLANIDRYFYLQLIRHRQMYAGQRPYHHLVKGTQPMLDDYKIITAIKRGETPAPKRPQSGASLNASMPAQLWLILLSCWRKQAVARPKMQELKRDIMSWYQLQSQRTVVRVYSSIPTIFYITDLHRPLYY
jgi:hypothetical protein